MKPSLCAVALLPLGLLACSDPPSVQLPEPVVAKGPVPSGKPGGDGTRPPGPESGGLPPGDEAASLPPGPESGAGAQDEGTEGASPAADIPVSATAALPYAAAVVDPGAAVQPGSWVDAIPPSVLRSSCELEEIDSLGDLLDGGRFRLDPRPGGFSLVPRPDPEEPEEPEADDDDNGLELGLGLPDAVVCSLESPAQNIECEAVVDTVAVEGGGTLSVRHQFLMTLHESRLLTVEVWSQAACEGCARQPAGIQLPCASKLRRVLLFEGTEGALGPVKEGSASKVPVLGPAVPSATAAPSPADEP